MSAWCVVNTLPHQEARAETNLLRQGFRAWLPIMRGVRRHARRMKVARVPLFPGYLFVELDLECESWSPINSTYGVRRLLMRDMRPERLPNDFVDTLRGMAGKDGVPATHIDPLAPGSRVKIVSGPFSDCIAIICNLLPEDRVKLLINILGSGATIIMSRFTIAPQD